MTFDNIPSGTSIFVDSNCLIYEAIGDPKCGMACKRLLERIENRDLIGYTSSHVLAEMVHRLTTIETSIRLSRPLTGMANWLRRHPTEIQKCSSHRQAIQELYSIPLKILSIEANQVSIASDVMTQLGMLMNDALIVAVMQENGITDLASLDGDFDRVPGIQRHTPT